MWKKPLNYSFFSTLLQSWKIDKISNHSRQENSIFHTFTNSSRLNEAYRKRINRTKSSSLQKIQGSCCSLMIKNTMNVNGEWKCKREKFQEYFTEIHICEIQQPWMMKYWNSPRAVEKGRYFRKLKSYLRNENQQNQS